MDIDIINQNLSRAGLGKVKAKTIDPAKDKQLKEACEGFESIMYHTLIKSMRQTLPGNAVFKTSNAMDIYQSMQDQHLSDHLAKSSSGLGLKEILYENLKGSI